ncbi:MAG: carbohydrate ABC transporter permease [Clostridiales bacterium]|nr:carbohydrate ABC transporter permease [Clostridiales bacterium]
MAAIRRKRFRVSQILIYAFLILWSLTTVLPFLWVVINSFKNRDIIQTNAFSLLFEPTLDNYIKTFTRPPQSVGMAYLNSVIISGSVTILVMLFAGMAAFAMTRYRFRGRKALDALIIASLMFPVFSTIIPVFQMMSSIHVVDNPLGVILPQTAGNLAFAIVILMGYIRGLPVDLEESAFLEGCNVIQVFYKVIVPICRPAFATVAIFAFLWSYNDLFTQLFFLRSPKTWAITRFLNEVSSQFGTDYGMMCAVVTLIVIPVLIVYIFLQKNIIRGLTAGAIKG